MAILDITAAKSSVLECSLAAAAVSFILSYTHIGGTLDRHQWPQAASSRVVPSCRWNFVANLISLQMAVLVQSQAVSLLYYPLHVLQKGCSCPKDPFKLSPLGEHCLHGLIHMNQTVGAVIPQDHKVLQGLKPLVSGVWDCCSGTQCCYDILHYPSGVPAGFPSPSTE